MNFELSEQQKMLQEMFSRLFRTESTPARVRAAEPLGFDAELWRHLVEVGAPMMRVGEAHGGGGVSLLDAAVVIEEAGRWLASVPLVEAIVVNRLLARLPDVADSAGLLELAATGRIVTLAVRGDTGRQMVPAGAIAREVLWLDDERVVMERRERNVAPPSSPRNLGTLPVCTLEPPASAEMQILGAGAPARAAFLEAVEEWKLLTAAWQVGAADQTLRNAAAYSGERMAFGKAIGSFQGVAHPLADSICDVDGARLAVWRAICAAASGAADAPASAALAGWFVARVAGRAATRGVRVLGGYGVTMEYDAQLYLRRIKGTALLGGDPHDALLIAGDRLWGGSSAPTVDAGEVTMSFSWGESATQLAEEARAFFASRMNEDLASFGYRSDDGHHPELFQQLAAARLLYPEWPETYLGRGCDGAAASAVHEVFNDFDIPILVPVVTEMVGKMLLKFGTEAACQEILPKLANGSAYCSLGYTEPSGGSDVFAVKTTAARDGDEWVVNGQKMFTTQGHMADYALMLVRTEPGSLKHAGLTLFVLPLDQRGYESQHVRTLGSERTNITYYQDMRVPDRYRLGEINGGAKVMGAALTLEQGVGLYNVGPLKRLLKHALRWAREPGTDGKPRLEDRQVRARLARVVAHLDVADALTRRSIWAGETGCSERWYGSMSKLFGSEAWLSCAEDLLELTAPGSLYTERSDTGYIELDYRRSLASTIYGGTSEVHRSVIAETALRMPRSRA